MTYKETLDYILKIGYKYFNKNFKLRDFASYYEDELNYRIFGDIDDTNISLDFMRSSSSTNNGIMIWGIEREILRLSKRTIKKAFKLTYRVLKKTFFIKCVSKNDEFLSEFSFISGKEFNEKEINCWFNEHLINNTIENNVYKLVVRYPYSNSSKEYIRDEKGRFQLKR